MLDSEELRRLLLAAVDGRFYHFAYPEIAPADAGRHYADTGWREGRDPTAWFSTTAYARESERYPKATGVPLFDYLLWGRAHGIKIEPSIHAERYYRRGSTVDPKPDIPLPRQILAMAGSDEDSVPLPAPQVELSDAEAAEEERAFQRSVVSPAFDPDYYTCTYPDIVDAGVDPFEHFMEQGWREGRNPTAWFSTAKYLEANGDVAEAGVNPFFHYVVAGRSEGRQLSLGLGFRHDILHQQTSFEDRMRQAAQTPDVSVSGADVLNEIFASLGTESAGKLHLSISHDDYTRSLGGLQLCLHREADAFSALGYSRIHLFPARPILWTDHENSNPILGVVVNGTTQGYFHSSDLIAAFGVLRERVDVTLAIHSILGHSAKALVSMFEALGVCAGYFWIHDFASICAGHNLLRNDVEYCDGPSPESAACALCVYGDRRAVQVRDHELIFDALPLTVISPAQKTLETWRRLAHLRVQETRVLPHCTLLPRKNTTADQPEERDQFRPLKVAYLGFPHAHKGWPIFRELALSLEGDRRYEFYHLGAGRQPGLPIRYHEIAVSGSAANEMAEAISRLEIDAAVIWSLCPETFCFTAHEAIAGGAVVITNDRAGNLSQLVLDTGKGLILKSEADLRGVFESGSVMGALRARRNVEEYDIRYSNMTADAIRATTA